MIWPHSSIHCLAFRDDAADRISALSHFVHEYLIWLLLAAYAIAAVWPSFGLWIRSVSFGQFTFWHESTTVSLPMLMLALLLLNAGLGVRTSGAAQLAASPGPLLGGLTANLVIPIAYVFLVSVVMRVWKDEPDEVQNILVGLALIAAMPIAGSSTAWTQNANGDIALSLGLVLLSTFLSPITSPIAFDLIEHMASGEYAEALENLETNSTGFLLLACVLLPSVAGIALGHVAGPERIQREADAETGELGEPAVVELFERRCVAAAGGRGARLGFSGRDDLDLGIMCVAAFASGAVVARLLKVGAAQRSSLMLGLGMNNNGTGLVLASIALGKYPGVALPVIFYNLIQHLVAGGVDRWRTSREPATPASA